MKRKLHPQSKDLEAEGRKAKSGKRLRRLRSAWTKTVTVLARVFRQCRSYARRKKWTSATLVISLLSVTLIVYWIYSLFRLDEPKTHLQLSCIDSGYDITHAEAFVLYGSGGDDTVMLNVSFKQTEAELKGKRFIIEVSPNLRRVSGALGGFKHCDSYTPGWLCYEFDGSGRYSLNEEYAGHVFGHIAQDTSMDFSVGANRFGAVTDVPIDVFIEKLNGVTVSTIYPDPAEKYWDGAVFHFRPNSLPNGMMLPANVTMTGADRRAIYSNQFRLFLLGVLLGILSSIIAAILLDAIQQIEKR